MEGSSPFTEEFAARGPRDSRGRSLRDFDLQRRLFKYPCSYLIYSPSFDGLPPAIKKHVERRLLEVLVRNPGRLVGQRQLLQEVCGPEPGMGYRFRAGHSAVAPS